MKKKVFILILLFLIIIVRIVYLNYFKHDYYLDKLESITNKYVYGSSAPRGRIIDVNGNVLVDNIGVKAIYYSKLSGVTQNDEIEIAYSLANILDIPIDESSLKDFYIIINDGCDYLITDSEWQEYRERKLNSDDIYNLKIERITDDDIDNLTETDKKSATIYKLMNVGYSYSKKLIIKDISDEEYSLVVDANIKGVTTELVWERVYNYGDTLKDIFGSIGYIPEENLIEYLNNGYSIDDIVGISYLEYQYEEYLKGEKDLYKVNSDNTLTLVKEGSRGSDLILSIDIEVQLELESIIEKYMKMAFSYTGTENFSETYAIVGDPNTGAIIAMSGRKYDKQTDTFINANTNLINTSYTVGSIVKMATVTAGYKYGVIDIGTSLTDACVKLNNLPIKCSYKSLGVVDDLTAISKSSNYYQFLIAIGLTGSKYTYNMTLNNTDLGFQKLRSVQQEYGLGTITGIDLPNETTGIIGNNLSSDLLLNLSIGQYDTYTPVELFQYVNTVASLGSKRIPYLMYQVSDIINGYNVVSNVSIDLEYKMRLKEAMHLATISGTARNYIDSKYLPAGKTGTSETYVDTAGDGVMDTLTTSIAFVGFAPYDSPEYSIVVLSPNIYTKKSYEYGKIYITRYISREIMNFLFEKE